MKITLLQGPKFGDFFHDSKVYSEVVKLVFAEANRDTAPSDKVDDIAVKMAVQLCAETLIKHNLTLNHISRCEMFDFIDADNSKEIKKYYKAALVKKETVEGRKLTLQMRWLKSVVGLVMSRLAMSKKRDLTLELKQEFLSFATT